MTSLAEPQTFTLPPDFVGLRLDVALARLMPEHSRSRLALWVKSGHICVDGLGLDPDTRVLGGETISVSQPPSDDALATRAEAIALDVVYEDDSILVLNKAPGLVVHPGAGNREGTLLNALLHHVPTARELPRGGIVHRLDKETSGLMVVAKTLIAQTSLVRQLQARTVTREYLALVQGELMQSGHVDAPIGRHPTQRVKMAVVTGERGKAAVTHFVPVEQFEGCTLVRCKLETGRTHQIRVHMQHIGHPLLGDPVYGLRSRGRSIKTELGRQALHATKLALVHPVKKKTQSWQVDMPRDMKQLIKQLRKAVGD